jgi:hypothetical protein
MATSAACAPGCALSSAEEAHPPPEPRPGHEECCPPVHGVAHQPTGQQRVEQQQRGDRATCSNSTQAAPQVLHEPDPGLRAAANKLRGLQLI